MKQLALLKLINIIQFHPIAFKSESRQILHTRRQTFCITPL